MASFSTSVGNGYTLTLTTTVTSQSVSTNKSVVSWVLQLEKGHTYYVAKHTGSVSIAGIEVWSVTRADFDASPSRHTMTVASGSVTVSHDASGSATIACAASLKTNSQGYSWSLPQASVSGTMELPTIGRLPNAPGAPTVSQVASNREITAISPVASTNGAAITGYQIQRTQYFSGVGWSGWQIFTVGLGARRLTFIPDKTFGTFVFQGRAITSVGAGPWSASSTAILGRGSGPMARVAGTFGESDAYVKVAGVWKPAISYARVAGVWKETRR